MKLFPWQEEICDRLRIIRGVFFNPSLGKSHSSRDLTVVNECFVIRNRELQSKLSFPIADKEDLQ